MYDDISYRKPFLKEVIIKFDFSSPITELAKSLPPKISHSALTKFPISEPKKTHSSELMISPTEVKQKTEESMEWTFHGKEREKTLVIGPAAFVVMVRKYTTYEMMKTDMQNTIKTVFDSFPDIKISRIGLRYVNVIEVTGEDPLAWDSYINEKILGIIDFHESKEYLSRAFHILVYNFDGQSLKCQFGIVNPDYPAVIKRKQFILDLDSFYHGAFDLTETLNNLDKSHERIQEFFEKSITDETRTLMKQVKDGQ